MRCPAAPAFRPTPFCVVGRVRTGAEKVLVPRPPLPVVIALILLGLVPPLAASARSGKVRPVLPGATHGDRIPDGADRTLKRQLRKIRRTTFGAASTSGLRTGPWCGVEQATDDTTHQAHTGPRVKVIYAYPSDRPNRFATMRDLIQGDARDMSDMLLGASGQTKTLRFDVGTKCGAGYVDILSIRLPRTANAYRQLAAGGRMTQLRTDLAPSVAAMTGKRNYLVYADHVYASDGVAGIATVYLDDRPGSTNAANTGGLWAMAFGDGNDANFLGSRLTTVLHEVSHNLGAVQDSAPHSTGAGHCSDEYDVMCYDDGGPSADMSYPCAQQAYDCGGDDYFNAAPASGSYLDTHWNLYRSTFLCPAGSCAGADVGGGNPVPVASIAAAQATVGTPITLDGSGSTDEEGVAEYAWDVGADGTVEGRDARLTTTFAVAGTVPVRLTVRDAYGAAGSTTATIRVVAPAVAPPPAPRPEPPARAPSRRELASRALQSSLGSLRAGLASAQSSARVRLTFTAPQRGRLEARLTLGTRRLATATRSVRSGRAEALTVRLSRTARKRLARGGRATVRLVFRGADGGTVTAQQTVRLRRR